MIKRRSRPRRVSVARDPKYLEFLREQGWCASCWGRPVEPAHGFVNGMGSKGSDLACVPLCRPHHMEEHTIGARRFWEKNGIAREFVVAYWNQQYKEMMNDESSK